MAVNEGRGLRSQIKLAGMGLALLILVLFVAFNFDEVEIDLLVAKTNIRLAFALIFTALMGFVIGYFAPRRLR